MYTTLHFNCFKYYSFESFSKLGLRKLLCSVSQNKMIFSYYSGTSMSQMDVFDNMLGFCAVCLFVWSQCVCILNGEKEVSKSVHV